jgi:tetratricopeptide (TPR) repeat protein
LQLLEANIGDVEFLGALEHVHKLSASSSSSSALETELWKALDVGLKNSKADNLMIVVDGLDDRLGHQNADKIGNKLAVFASTYKHVRAIFLSRNTVHLNTVKTHGLAITPDHTQNDLQHLTEHALKGCQHYISHNDHEQEAIAVKITHAVKGNFLTAQLIIKRLKRQESRDAFKKAADSLKEAHLESSIQNLVSTATADFSKPEANLLLSWLLVAERPLTVSELKGLLQVDLQKKTLISRKTDIVDDIQNLCGLLVRIQNGIVRFRHGAIRDYLTKVQHEGKKLPTVQSAQGALAIRLLAYSNLRLTDPCDPSFERPDSAEIDRLFIQDTLLEYATRNWILHFKKSSWYKASGAFELPSDFKANFSGSVYFSMMEWACWEVQTPVFEAIDLHNLALRLREAVFTEKHHIVLQTLIIIGIAYKKVTNASEAGSCFYRASRIGQSILKANSVVTLTCTTSFLKVTETITSTTRTEIISRKEEMLQYAISAYKLQYGTTHDIVIRYCTTLAEMYVAIHEESKAETIYRELHEIMISRYGKGSVEETTVSGHISVVLKPEKHDEIIEYEKKIFDTTSELEIWDVRRITVTLKLAAAYEAGGELFKAEELYVMLWSRLVEHCHQVHIHHVDITVHISMMDVSLDYVRFLRRCHRDEEAAGVLICIWNEYEEYDFESEVIFLRLKVVGELMRAISLLSIAVSVFKKCWSWFKLHEKHEHVESCQILISETTEEIVTTSTQTTVSTTTSTTTSTTETVIKEVFESTISKSIVTKETISICRSLVSFYFKSEQWSDVIKTSKRSLQLIWRTIVSGGGTIALPREFAAEAIEIAIKMAICHQRLHHFHEAETIYLRIYRACFNSCHIHDERLEKAYTSLIKFYREHGHWNRVIEVYQEVLNVSRTHLGATHALTIKILYELGSLCSKHGHGHPDQYYEEIITVLNAKSHVCHHDAFRAMQIMSKIYYEQGHWQNLKVNCEILWETWRHHHTVHKFEVEFIELLYMRYIYVLEHHSTTSHDFILTITLQFRDTCVIVYGASATVTIGALVELAQICMRSEKHIHEAISYYEEVSAKTIISELSLTKFILGDQDDNYFDQDHYYYNKYNYSFYNDFHCEAATDKSIHPRLYTWNCIFVHPGTSRLDSYRAFRILENPFWLLAFGDLDSPARAHQDALVPEYKGSTFHCRTHTTRDNNCNHLRGKAFENALRGCEDDC